MSLERRCARIARAYPRSARRDEVLATLLDANEGRRSPRLRDAVDVLRHGFAVRLRGGHAPAPAGWWREAGAVLVVSCVVAFAATTVVIGWTALFPEQAAEPGRPWVRIPLSRIVARHPSEVVVTALATAVAVAGAVTCCLGRVLPARLATLAAAFGGASVYAVERASGEHQTFTTWTGMLIVATGVAVVLAVLGTGSVERAARAVPRAAWAVSGVLGTVAAWVSLVMGEWYTDGYPQRSGLVLAALAAALPAVLVVALSVSLALRSARRFAADGVEPGAGAV